MALETLLADDGDEDEGEEEVEVVRIVAFD